MQSGGYPPQGGGYPPQGGAPIPPPQGGPSGYGGGPGSYGGGPGGYRPQGPPVNATMPLVFGILSLVCCGIFGPIALVQANGIMAQINNGAGTDSDRTMITISRVLGIIGCVFLVLQLLYVGFVVLAIMSGAGRATHSSFQPSPGFAPR